MFDNDPQAAPAARPRMDPNNANPRDPREHQDRRLRLFPATRGETAAQFGVATLAWLALLAVSMVLLPADPALSGVQRHSEPRPPPTTRLRRLLQGDSGYTLDDVYKQSQAFLNGDPTPGLGERLEGKLQEVYGDNTLQDVYYPFNLTGSYRGTGWLNFTEKGQPVTAVELGGPESEGGRPSVPSTTVLRIRTFSIAKEDRFHQAQIRVMLTPELPNVEIDDSSTISVMIQAHGLYDTLTGQMQAVSNPETFPPKLPKFEDKNLSYPTRVWPATSKGHFKPSECQFLVDVIPDSITEDIHKREMAGREAREEGNSTYHLRRTGAYSAIMDREYIDVHVQAEVFSLNESCTNVSRATATADLLRYDLFILKGTKYALVATFLSFTQLLIIFRQMQFSTPASSAQKLSLASIAMNSVFDAYLCLIHLTTGLYIDDLFNSFIMVSFLQFMVFSMFDLRLVLLVWRARHPEDFSTGTGWETIRSTLTKIYSGFYGGVFVCLVFYYYVRHYMNHFVFLLFAFWIPQIVRNVRTGERFALQDRFLYGVTGIRLFFPLYAFGCPQNFLEFPTNIVVCVLLVLFAGFQVAMIKGQDRWGSRFFIPKRFQPDYYEYHRAFDEDPEEDECCAICMSEFMSNENLACEKLSSPETSPSSSGSKKKCRDLEVLKNKVLTTPCNHRFCRECLMRWMETKMQCPTCRASLPPYTI